MLNEGRNAINLFYKGKTKLENALETNKQKIQT